MNKRMELRTKNNELVRLLNEENHAIMTDMVVHLRVTRISHYRVELIRQDLLDMALNAQERNVPLSEVFGQDYKGFCDEIIGTVKLQGRMIGVMQWVMYMSGIVAFLAVLNMVFSGYLERLYHDITSHSKVNLHYPITVGFMLNAVAILTVSNLIVYFIGKSSFETKGLWSGRFHEDSKLKKFAIGCLAGTCIVGYVFLDYELNHYVVISINVFVYVSVVIALFAVNVVIARR